MRYEALLDLVRAPYERDCRKHGLAVDPEQYADDHINAMSNVELLRALGERFEEAVREANYEENED